MGAIQELGKLPAGFVSDSLQELEKMAFLPKLLDDGLAEQVAEAQGVIDSNLRGTTEFVNKERLGKGPKKKVKRKWRESSFRPAQGEVKK